MNTHSRRWLHQRDNSKIAGKLALEAINTPTSLHSIAKSSLIAIVVTLAHCSFTQANDLPQSAAIRVKATAARLTDLTVDVFSHCTVHPFRKSVVTAQINGQITKRFIEPGNAVKVGETLLQIDQSETRNQLQQTEARLRTAKAQLERKDQLVKQAQQLANQNSVSQDTLDQMLNDLELADADFDLAVATVGETRRKLLLTSIKAPFTGIIQSVEMQLGDYAAIGKAASTVIDFSKARLLCGIGGHELSTIQDSGEASITLADLGGITFTSETFSTAGLLKNSTGNYIFELWIEDTEEQQMQEGMTATAHWRAIRPDTLVVPNSAIMKRGAGIAVYVLADGVAHLRYVKTGARTNELVEIVAGVERDEWIAIEGHFTLANGSAVSIEQSDIE